MNLKVKWKLTTIILFLLLCNFISTSEAKRKKNRRKYKSQALPAEKWNAKWATECGLSSSVNKYPWIVAIYAHENIKCYGTIISPHHILTALYCLPLHYLYHKGKLSRRKYTIVAGRHKSERYDAVSSQQSRKIREIFKDDTSKIFRLSKERYMVILAVDVPFEFTDDVRSACVDWASFYEDWYFREGSEGTAVGWKDEHEKMVPCSSSVQYWQKHLCWENLPEDFRTKYFGNDKYCAKYVDDNSTCGKAEGQGLFFNAKDRYFLRGVITLYDTHWESYVLYRKISNYLEWLKISMKGIKTVRNLFDSPKIPVYEKDAGCVLPIHVKYGKFRLITGKTYLENTWVPLNTTILLYCDDSNESDSSFRCSNFNTWTPSVHRVRCKKPGSCPTLLDSESENIHCYLNGSQISCEEPSENTTAVIKCEPFHNFPGENPIYKCHDRKWDPPLTSCILECGIKRVDVSTLAIGGREAQVNEYPWIVAIYFGAVQVCGGTLISRLYVLSAAHCFVNSNGTRNNKGEYTIAAGKHYRNIGIQEEASQKRKIKVLKVHENYRASAQKHRDDIAIIRLDEKFTVSLEVQPVCIDWDNNFENIDFTLGKVGIVAGWGYTREGGSPSNVLKKLIMPFQPKNECVKHFPTDFSQEFLATDKFCAGYIDKNTNVCQGDSGGGIYFKSDGTHYFIRGIVSLTRRSSVGCDSNHFSLYTKVSKYLAWIEKITRKVL